METLYLTSNNMGLWAAYRKKCPPRSSDHDKTCKKLHEQLFR